MNQLKEQIPGGSVAQLMKKAGEMWAALSEEQKAPYFQSGLADRERYNTELKAWKANPNKTFVDPASPSSGKKKSSKSTNENDKRKGHVTSFIIFCQEKKEVYKKSNPNIKPTEVSQLAG